ncbi:alanine aminotransferase [Thermococcus litoralis DSM 5473]|uniref:Alanine aminotransferase n=3 Tax=Thermococcus TaxID=2263 RepID=H3ZPA9_THELN|nr:pyridoxal phosphate-dependent aminotransferase [Thermococcus litoralis]AAG00592.1 alanine aminotransferase [Thermococcus sp. TK1]AAK98527.1 alanine aminotransferase-like protein [Thermococcus litoralis]EHR78144.1 alanine aminotransferase [Thermococcus litoralis DSM 5473]
MVKASKRAMSIEYAIRDVVLPARELEKQGIKIIKLNIGDPVKFDFQPPEHMKKAYCEAIMEGHNYYGDSEGDRELREAIVEREKKKNGVDITPEDVQVTAAVTEALQFIFGALIDGGEEILIPGPSYPPYVGLVKFYGGVPKAYRTVEEEGWQPDIDDMRKKITEKTKAIAVINPNNPTGALYEKKTLQEIIDLAGEYDLPIISDEIYDLMTYEGKHVSPGSLTKDVPVIVMNGLSKVYFATGWRLGYMYFVDPENKLAEVREAIGKLARIRLCPNTPAQKAAIAGLRGPMDYLEEYMAKLKERRDYIYKRLNEMPGISTQKPQGAFYIFPKIEEGPWKSDKEFVLDVLHNAHVLFVHGSGFGEGGEMHFRSIFLAPVPVLEEAMDNLEKFMKERLG